MKSIVILGSTGSIGQNTLEVIRHNPGLFRILGLACKSRKNLLASQIKEFQPEYVCLEDPDKNFITKFPGVKFLSGEEGLASISTRPEADLIIVAIPGLKSLIPVLKSLENGKTIGLASKEIMVVAGNLIMETARRHQRRLLPLDSEHNALFQVLEKEKAGSVQKVYLTASGGPFRNETDLKRVGVPEVLAHPVWKMGAKITVDSATLMNKAFEIIEAHHLFNLPSEKIEVLIHPEAIIHGLIEFRDGVMYGVLSRPDMKYAINFVLNYPERHANPWPALHLDKIGKLTFALPDKKEAWLSWARQALEEGGSFPVVLNGANEEAVRLFLTGQIKFHQIIELIKKVLGQHKTEKIADLSDIFDWDTWAKETTRQLV